MITEREESAGKPTNRESKLPNGKAMTDRELMQQALDALALAKSSHNMVLSSDPPQSAWRYYNVDMKLLETITALRERLAQPEQKLMIDCPRCGHCCPQRPWIGLTDEEIKSLPSWWPSYEDAPALIKLVKDVEAKLKEKNGE